MKKLIAFFEIPATDFHRAIDFYETVLNMKLPTCECEEEKMAFLTEGDEFVGAVSYASDFLPSEKGAFFISHFLHCRSMWLDLCRSEAPLYQPACYQQVHQQS